MIAGFLAQAAANLAASTIISYQSGAFDADIDAIKGYVDAKVDSLLNRKDK